MPTRPRPPALIAAAFAALLAWAPAPVLCDERSTSTEPVWFDTIAPDGTPGHTVSALLNVPPTWMFSDAAVLLLSDGPWPGLARERLMAALLGEGAAVLELDVTAARGFSPENAWMAPPATAEELLPDVRGAADALRRDTGAGLVVALGHGAGGDAAVLAAELERAGAPGAGADIAAAASLGPGPAHFAFGGAATGRGWPVRAELLCEVLATEALRFEPGADTKCRRALVGSGEAYAGRVGKP